MTERKLSKKQELFIAAFLRSFNATEAARQAGYSSPRPSGTENMANPAIKARINEHLEEVRAEGIGNRATRLAHLNNLHEDLLRVQRTRAQEAKDRYANGDEDVPEGAETGLMVEQTKQVGTGNNAVVTKEWALDKSLVKSMQDTLEHAAKEAGDRDKRLFEVSGPEGGPVRIESAKDRLLELFGDETTMGDGDG